MYQQIETAHRQIVALTADCRPEEDIYRFAGDAEARLATIETALRRVLAEARDAADMASFSRLCRAQCTAARVREAGSGEALFRRLGEIVTQLS